MTATHSIDNDTSSSPVLFLAFELGWNSWKLVFTTGKHSIGHALEMLISGYPDKLSPFTPLYRLAQTS